MKTALVVLLVVTLAVMAFITVARQLSGCSGECEIRLRAERRAGQLLAEMEKNQGARGNPGGQGAPIVSSQDARAQTLADLGITYDQSSKWQPPSHHQRRTSDGDGDRVSRTGEAQKKRFWFFSR